MIEPLPIKGVEKFELIPDGNILKLRVALGWANNAETTGDYIRLSIEKWEAIVIAIEQRNLYVNNNSNVTCALCLVHSTCMYCPVATYTDRYACQGTSYYDYVECNRTNTDLAISYAKQMVTELKEVLRQWEADNETDKQTTTALYRVLHDHGNERMYLLVLYPSKESW